MTLAPGTRLGPYEVVALIGAGGMGEVYRARDAKLNRDVAIKVLPEAFAADRERVARFEREAQTLAALNHQNIAHVHGIVEHPAGLVMELVEGVDLSARIGAGGMAIDDALPIARQVAEALEAAHERGVVHRDLKPANIKVRDDGVVKVLDFGLAKAMDSSGAASAVANSPTFMTAATQIGTILGTAAYMSPEQARGKPVDKRADIWAFGCVLFEMLTGRRPFEGETITEVLGAIIHKAPDFSLLPATTPPPVTALIARCLEKDVTRRLRDIGEARVALETSQMSHLSRQVATAPAAAPAREPWRRALAPAAIVGALAAGIALGAIAWPRNDDAAPSLHLTVALPDGFLLSHPPVISPDGKTIAYVGATDREDTSSLYIRALDSFEARAVPGSVNPSEPFFSPDSRDVGFLSRGHMQRVRVGDNAVTRIATVPNLTGASWGDDGFIVFSTGVGSGIQRVSADGGPIERLTELEGTHYAHVWPQYQPGRVVLFRAWTSGDGGEHCRLTISDRKLSCADSHSVRVVGQGFALTDGSGGALGAFPASDGQTGFKGQYTTIISPVYWRPNASRGYYSVSAGGTLAYVPGSPMRQRIVWMEKNGSEKILFDENNVYDRVSLSPDGKRIAYGGGGNVWVFDVERGTRTRISTDANNIRPMWSHDGRRVIFSSNRQQTWAGFAASAADGWAETQILKRAYSAQPTSIAADGSLLFTETNPKTSSDIWLLRADGKAVPIVATGARESEARFSPDARHIAYISNPNGRTEVFIRPLAGGETVQVSTQGGDGPVWSRDGRWLYYSQRATIMRVAIAAGRPGLPQPMLQRADLAGVLDTSLDGQSFLTVKLLPESYPSEIRIITNFFEELRAKVK